MGSISADELTHWDARSNAHEEKIFVSVRLRPLNDKEIARNDVSDWECINNTTIIFKNNTTDRSLFPTAYTFGRVFGSEYSTKQVYEEGAKEVTLSVVSGINSTIFAYGQTSSGKTYTMSGITEYTIADLFNYIHKCNGREFVLKFSAMEIYNEVVRDLLSPESTPLRLLDDPERGTVVEKLTEETLRDWNHLKGLLSVCGAQRQIGETALNEMSSRSHQIIRLTVESSTREFLGARKSSTLTAYVNFVDLAGSERSSQTLSAGARLKEGCHINRSLLTLGTVIRKLSKGRNGHIPYRDSKLTRILQNSLGGNARTAIICTMSPARSHVEQSRNTLLFASCAEQVSTNAQVNVVMSDKALVKQLQRELAKLEGELRSLVSMSDMPKSAALLKEKELLIEKMDEEIKELKKQRDHAESHVQDLLQSVGQYQVSRSLAECELEPYMQNAWVDEYSASELSKVVDPLSSVITSNSSHLSDRCNSLNSNKHNFLLPDHSEDQFLSDGISPRVVIDNLFGPDPSHGWEMTVQKHDEDSEDHCKEVQCIEVEESSIYKNIKYDVTLLPEKGNRDLSHIHTDPSYEVLKQKIEDMQKTIDYFANPCLIEQSPTSSEADMSDSSRSMKLSRSRSCRAILMPIASSPWFEKAEHKENTPPNGSEKDFPGRPEGGYQLKLSGNYVASTGKLRGKDSQISVNDYSMDKMDQKTKISHEDDVSSVNNSMDKMDQNTKISHEDDVSSVDNCAIELNEVVKSESEQQPGDDLCYSSMDKMDKNTNISHEDDGSRVRNCATELNEVEKSESEQQSGDDLVHEAKSKATKPGKTVEDVGMDLVKGSQQSPSNWPLEFETRRREIIELWDACNVPLTHRTHFFLLFKGDPSDSVYLEVELRRLSYLKSTLSHGTKVGIDGQIVTPEQSKKALNRERQKLSKQILKRFPAKEREALYQKWGIGLNTKQRRLQLSHRLWADTKDMNQIKDSAALIAKLVGFAESVQIPKEMFGLSFSPQPTNRKSSWKSSSM
ncbi:hypothetical protein ACSBR2_000268 [Camellia fascicularis]